MPRTKVLYSETQRFTQWWLVLIITLVIGATLGSAVATFATDDAGTGPSLVAVASLAGVALIVGGLLSSSLRVEVRSDGIEWRHLWLLHRHHTWDEIASAEAATYRWIRGYGWRPGRHDTLFNVKGNRAVRIEFKKGRAVLIGTQHPDKFVAAIHQAMDGRPDVPEEPRSSRARKRRGSN